MTSRPELGLAFCLALGCTLLSANTLAGDAAAGKEIVTICAACHGAEGVSSDVNNPILAGQYTSYIEHALKSYRDGSRQNAIMSGFASQLSDTDIENLAAYFSSLPGPMQTAPRP